MTYTGTKILVAGSDGVVHTAIEEAVEARNSGDNRQNDCHSIE